VSTFTWIDHSEKQRRQILEAIDLFREKDTRDELGIAGIRDAFSDMLFPGTGALQTRARYLLFVPWMYLDFEARRVPSAEVARRVRDVEVKLINTLAESSIPPPPGTIGIQARSSLQRFPSSIYWNGLKVLVLLCRAASLAASCLSGCFNRPQHVAINPCELLRPARLESVGKAWEPVPSRGRATFERRPSVAADDCAERRTRPDRPAAAPC